MRFKFDLPYVHQDKDRHGHLRLYYRRRMGEPKIRLRQKPGTPEFADEYAAAARTVKERSSERNSINPKPDTLAGLCLRYIQSSEFQCLDPSTRRTKERLLTRMLEEPIAPGSHEHFADFPVNRLTTRALKVLRDRKARLDLPEAANGRVRVLKRLFAWALENDEIESNPARDLTRLKNHSQGWHSWTSDELAKFEACHPVGSKARLALALLQFVAVRRSDVVRLGRQHVRDGRIRFTATKNQRRKPVTVDMPMSSELVSIIDRSPTGDLTFLVTERGVPFTRFGFGNWFRDRCDEAGLPDCSAHGVRKAAAARAAERGATTHELMAIFGWLSIEEAERYTREARRNVLAQNADRLLANQRPEK